MLQRMDGQTNRFLVESYIRSTFQLGDNEIYQNVLWYGFVYKLKRKIFLLLYENSKFVTLNSVTPGVGIMLSKTLGRYLPTCQI